MAVRAVLIDHRPLVFHECFGYKYILKKIRYSHGKPGRNFYIATEKSELLLAYLAVCERDTESP